MKYKWLIEQRMADEDYQKLTTTLKKRNIDFAPFKGMFSGLATSGPEQFEEPFVFHGTIGGAIIAHSWETCVLPFTPKNYACTKYYPRFASALLNWDYRIYQCIQEGNIFNDFRTDALFVRPDSGLKNFVGGVLYEGVDSVRAKAAYYDESDFIIVAKPKSIGKEWRLLFKRNEDGIDYVAGSMYSNGGTHTEDGNVPKEVSDWTEDLLNRVDYCPDELFYADVAEVGGKLAFNEFSAFMCAGLYAIDLDKVVDCIMNSKWLEF